jgi:hypothetical protein
MSKSIGKYFSVALISISLSTPTLAQVADSSLLCRQQCQRELQYCLARAPNAYARSICLESYEACAEYCTPTGY